MSLLQKLRESRLLKKLVIPTSLALGMSYATCSKNPAGPDVEPPPKNNSYVSYSEDTKEIEQPVANQISHLDEQKIVFESPVEDTSSYKVGNILRMEGTPQYPKGFLGRIDYISQNRDTIKTSNVAVEEAIDSCHVYFEATFDNSNADLKESSKGVSSTNVVGDRVSFNVQKTIDIDGDDNTQNDRFDFYSDVSAGVTVGGEMEIGGKKLKYLEFYLNVDEDMNIKLTSHGEPLQVEKQFFIRRYPLPPANIGGLMVTPSLSFYGGVEGKIPPVEVGLEQKANFKTSIAYQDNSWSHSNTLDNELIPSFSFSPKDGEVKAYITARLDVSVYWSAGLYGDAEGSATYKSVYSPSKLSTGLFGGLEVVLGAHAEVFGTEILGYSYPVLSKEFPIKVTNAPRIVDEEASHTQKVPGLIKGVFIGALEPSGYIAALPLKMSHEGVLNTIDVPVITSHLPIEDSEGSVSFDWTIKDATNMYSNGSNISSLPVLSSGSAMSKGYANDSAFYYGDHFINLSPQINVPVHKGQELLLQIERIHQTTDPLIMWEYSSSNPSEGYFSGNYNGVWKPATLSGSNKLMRRVYVYSED